MGYAGALEERLIALRVAKELKYLGSLILIILIFTLSHSHMIVGYSSKMSENAEIHFVLTHVAFNPLMLTAAKDSLTILMKSYSQKHCWENISRRNVS